MKNSLRRAVPLIALAADASRKVKSYAFNTNEPDAPPR
jgi:hypothetical protein